MTSTKKLIIANWKMSVDRAATTMLTRAASEELGKRDGHADVILCPPFPYLQHVRDILGGGVRLGAQDVAVPDHPNGAQTGDVSPRMLRELGCDYVIIGHSERRARYGETNALIRAKLMASLTAGLTPILCVGETAAQRSTGQGTRTVQQQLMECLPPDMGSSTMVIAYEPVWAISGGNAAAQPAQPADIAATHRFIVEECVPALAPNANIRMVYGASVKGDNAAAVLALPHVDGALVGRASTVADDMRAIIRVAAKFYI
jgi:triosephosphate isomerase (TIM)